MHCLVFTRNEVGEIIYDRTERKRVKKKKPETQVHKKCRGKCADCPSCKKPKISPKAETGHSRNNHGDPFTYLGPTSPFHNYDPNK